MKALIDTCIILDVLQKREPFFEDAHLTFLGVANRQFEGFISAKSVTDIYYLMHRFFHDDLKTRETLEILFKLFSILDTTQIDCKKAILSSVSDYEDAVMIETALRTNMDCIVTRNIHDYSKSVVKVYSPNEFLTVLNQSEINQSEEE